MAIRNKNKRFTAVQIPVKLHQRIEKVLQMNEKKFGMHESISHFVATACLNEIEKRVMQNCNKILLEDCESFDSSKYNFKERK